MLSNFTKHQPKTEKESICIILLTGAVSLLVPIIIKPTAEGRVFSTKTFRVKGQVWRVLNARNIPHSVHRRPHAN